MPPAPEQNAALLLSSLRSVLAQVAEPIQVLRTILDQAVVQTSADRGVFVEVSRDGRFDYRVLHRVPQEHLSGASGEYSRSVFGHVLRTGEGIVIDNALKDPRFMSEASVKELRLASILCVPIPIGGETGALVHLEKSVPSHFGPTHRELVESLVAIAGPVLETLRAGSEMLQQHRLLRASAGCIREEVDESRELLARDWSFGRFVGRSQAVRELQESVRKACTTEFPVLITGETGTGKSIIARILHHAGPRSREAFMTVFCPSLERGMVETALFGHKKGAFTGAEDDRIGKVQAAERGTLFLDEIGELPLEIQAKLLRLLQERTFERVGDTLERKADVRIIASTNRDLELEIAAGRFRRDLHERLNYLPIRVPPLRQRRDDIPLLLRHCLDSHPTGKWAEVTQDALGFLIGLDFAWPGNVRHLEQLAARMSLESKAQAFAAADLERLLNTPEDHGSTASRPPARRSAQAALSLEAGLPALLEQAERTWLEQALQRYKDLTRAQLADKLKISRSALYKKLRLYDLGD